MRRSYGWPAGQPVFGCDGGVLRISQDDGQWLLDNRLVHRMGDTPATFVWRFGTLDEAVAGALRFFAAKGNLEGRGASEPRP
jgi:hypothetical protein